MAKRAITRADILPMADYAAERKALRADLVRKKKLRRIEIGPVATFYFESYETMWHQVHEMLHIERGGEQQIEDELRAYNPLIPNGRELVATLMFEIDDPVRRAKLLAGLGGVEQTVTLGFGGQTIKAVPEADVDRTTAEGKASSIQFLHFPFSEAQVAEFRKPGQRVTLGIDHPKYAHMAVLSDAVKNALAKDLD
jgi:hypothetical protein